MKIRSIVGVFVSLLCYSNFAMPSTASLEKARQVIQELMADDFAALKSGKKTHEAVGDAAMGLIAHAETEASKYLLCKAAFGLYLRGKSYDKAADVLATFRKEIPDIPPADLVELVQKSAKGVRGKEAPKLFATYRALQTKATAREEMERSKAALEESPTSASLRRAHAEWCVLAGEWKTALASFVKLEGDFAKAAANESANPAAAADFWWTYEPSVHSSVIKDASESFKKHAVELYKKSMTDGSLTGLKKNLAEKRISQLESPVPTSSPSEPKSHSSAKYDSRSYVQKGLIAQWDGIDNVGFDKHEKKSNIWKDLKGGFDISLRTSSQIETDCIFCDGSSYAGYSKKKFNTNKIVTVEIVFEFISANGTSCLFSTGAHTKESYSQFLGYVENGGLFMFGPYVIGAALKNKTQLHMDFEAKRLFKKGVLATVIKPGIAIPKTERGFDFYIGGFLNSAVKCRLYAIRFYDRPLTPEEIATNYKIDSERFGL